MRNLNNSLPVVLVFGANDPCGGSGIQADIEALCAMGCHCAPVMTSITIRDTAKVHQISPIRGSILTQQARAILEDMPVAGIKIGAVGSVENVVAIHSILKDYPSIPVVLDPVLNDDGDENNIDPDTLGAIVALLLPLTTICTPNHLEARSMAVEADSLDACAQEIMAHGSDYVLIKGGYEVANKVTNTFYGNYRKIESYHWQRSPHQVHGAGCTLAASITGLLAQGLEPVSAIHKAQEYTAECMKHCYRIGMGEHIPNRLFWARNTACEYDVTNKH